MTDQQALVPQSAPPQGAAALPAPLFTGKQMADALKGYRELQAALDASMPEQLIELQGKQFRKKGYWRAVNVAFGLTVEPISEERLVAGVFQDGQENFGYNVTYRATAPTGRSATGDGACFAVEKAGRFKCPHPQQKNPNRAVHWPPESCPQYDPEYRWRRLAENATEHNVRSHAHTRAFNRAVSNLVGFGEVSAEEVDRNDVQVEGPTEPVSAGAGATPRAAQQAPPQPRQTTQAPRGDDEPPHPAETEPEPVQTRPAAAPARAATRPAARPAPRPAPRGGTGGRGGTGEVISEAQDRRYFALGMQAGWDPADLKAALLEVWNYERSDEILKSQYNAICAWVSNGPPKG